ncbi:MAG: glycosyltransferase family 2 protein, partial [Lachnospiraceae bacterium]|nr:glycosyltransferase family 2 protein [Lachnospiraceae bacterium]
EDLEKCLQSLFRSSYQNFEVIIIENNSEKPETFACYEQVQLEHANVKVVTYKAEGGFNYSKINNFGAQHANGEYLLLLNNDIEFIGTNCLEELLGYAMREDVGAVGARLYFEDDTIQHAGVVIGFGGIAGHTFVNQRREELGYFARAMCQQNYSAVTAACMLTRTEDFRSVGGLTEELSVAFNDIDYCMKLRKKGKLIVYNPYAEAHHYESKSRGAEDTPEKKLRFHREILWFGERWQKILDEGDPYYNPNLTLDRADFALKLSEERKRPKGYYMDLVRREVEKETNG